MRCAYGLCKSDSRYKDRDYMANIFFIPFPKPDLILAKCKTWLHACGRKDFGVKNVTRSTYICSKHFVGGMGPTKEHPNPIINSQAGVTKKKRKQPAARTSPTKKRILYTPGTTSAEVISGNEENVPAVEPGTSGNEENVPAAEPCATGSDIITEDNIIKVDKCCQTEEEPQSNVTTTSKGVQPVGEKYMRNLFNTIEKKYSASASRES